MYKIGVIGDPESTMGFLSIGFSVSSVTDVAAAKKALAQMASENYAIIYITENFAMQLEEEISAYKNVSLPAVITIPGKDGAKGYGLANIKRSVERAVGADVLFKD